MKTKTELLPCPFCGGIAKTMRDTYPDHGHIIHIFRVYCFFSRCVVIERTNTNKRIAESEAIKRWNTRVYPPRFIPETPAQVLEWLCSNYRSYEAFPDPQDDTYTLTAHDILSAFSWWGEDEYPPEVQAAIDRSKKEKVSLMPGGIGVCPNCLADIHDEITHCCHCGQRLDWSEE